MTRSVLRARPAPGVRRRSLAAWAAALALLVVPPAVAQDARAHPALGSLFTRPEQEQRALEAEIRRQRSTKRMIGPETPPAIAARQALTEVGPLLERIPKFVQENPRIFADYQRLLQPVLEARTALEALLARAPTAALSPDEMWEGIRRLEGARDALEESAGRAYDAGLAAYIQELMRPPVLVVSGGVSLGSYQAGLLYLYTGYLRHSAELLKARNVDAQEVSRFRIATGASAGSINAFLAAVESCRPPPSRRPEDSLLFQTWIPVGMTGKDGLYDPGAVSGNSIFSQAPLLAAVARVEALWKQENAAGWSRCNFDYGAPVTSLDARSVPIRVGLRPELSGHFTVPIPTEHFLLSFSNEAAGEAPRIRPYVPPGFERSPLFPTLSVKPGEEASIHDALSLLRASAAFPVAFQPIPLGYFVADEEQLRRIDARFVDGGAYDNNPLGIALGLDAWRSSAQPEARVLFVNSGAISFERKPKPGAARHGKPAADLAGTFGPFVGNYVEVASKAQLLAALESSASLPHRLEIPLRTTEVAGGLLMAFSGFFEEDFRIFDFYRGMVDARTHILAQSPLASPGLGLGPILPPIESDIYQCFVDFDAHPEEPSPACEKVRRSRPNLLVLLQATRDPFPDDGAERLPEFEARLRKLGYRFPPGDPLRDEGIASAARDMGGVLTERLAARQSTLGGRLLTATATENGLDMGIEYRPPPPFFVLGLITDGVEVAGSAALFGFGRSELRGRLGLRALPLQRQILDGNGASVWRSDLQPTAHLVFFPGWGDLVRPELLAGALEENTWVWSHGPRFYSARLAVEAGVGVMLLQRLEIQARPRLYLGAPWMGAGFSPPPGYAWPWGWSVEVAFRF